MALAPRTPIGPDLIGPWRSLVRLLEAKGISGADARDLLASIDRAEQQAAQLNQRIDQLGSVTAKQEVASGGAGLQLSSASPADVAHDPSSGGGSKASRDDHVHRGVRSLSQRGFAAMFGDLTLTGSGGITIAEQAQNIDLSGTSVTGTNHDILSARHSDTLAAGVVRGDVIVGNSTPKWSRLAAGAANTVLRSDGTDPAWSTGVLDSNARVTVRKNTGANVGTRRRLNLIEGTNITLTVADDAVDEEVDITVKSTSDGWEHCFPTASINPTFTPSNVFTDATLHIHDAGDIASGKKLAFSWASSGVAPGSMNAEWRIQDKTNNLTIASGTRSVTFAETVECLTPALSNLPVSCAKIVFQVRFSAPTASGQIQLFGCPCWRVA